MTYTPEMQTDPEEDYARGWVPFLDCKIFLESHPLIPRVETEYWVEQAIGKIREKYGDAPTRCLDLFAGSGAIGVAVLKRLPKSRVDFGEIDAAHLPTIRKNIRSNDIDENRTRVIETDVWQNIPDRYDVILANPPYISPALRDRVQDSVLIHEPEKALFAEENGLALIRKTLEGLKAHLLPGGTLYIEHEPEQSEALAKIASENGLVAGTFPDQYGLARWSAVSVA